MDLPKLLLELNAGHPDTGAYSADPVAAAVQLHAVNRIKVKPSMSGDAIFAATDATEFAALTDHKRELWLALCGRASVDPAGAANVALVEWIFGDPSGTLAALATARKDNVSRAVEIDLAWARPGHILEARL